jgi:hypothetical protein
MVGVSFKTVEPRMSRDFLIKCDTAAEAAEAERRLSQIVTENNECVFDVDNRGDSLFVMLTYPHEIDEKTTLRAGNLQISDFKNHVVFVAIKNGEHNGEGFLIDTEEKPKQNPIPLKSLPNRISSSFGLEWPT